MSVLQRVLKTIDQVNDFLGRKISFLILLIFGLLLMEVTLRYLFNSPTVWANELVQMLFGAYVVLAGGHILRWNGHVSVDIIQSKLSRKGRALIDVITSCLLFLFIGILLIQGWSLAWDSLSRLEHSESAWNPPLYPIKLMIPIGAFLLILQGFAKLVRDVMTLAGKEGFGSDEEGKKESS